MRVDGDAFGGTLGRQLLVRRRILIIDLREETAEGEMPGRRSARVPLAELYRYSTTLSSLTSGSATFSMEFADYQPVPGDVQTKLLAEYAASEKDDE